MPSPRLGIFWLIGEEIVSFSTPLERAEHAGGFANYRHGHVDLWRFVQRARSRLRGIEYECVARGRVTYDCEENTFNLLVPASVLNDRHVVRKLVGHFNLLHLRVRVTADQHYDPQ